MAASNYSIPDARTQVVTEKTGAFDMTWFLFLNNLFQGTGAGNVGATMTVLHGGGAGFSQVNLASDVSGTLPFANGGLGVSSASISQVLIAQSGGTPGFKTVFGDGTLVSTGQITVTQTAGVAFAASATTDTTNAANISAGKLPNARTSGLSVTITTAMLTPTGANGSMTFTNGLLTAQVAAT